MKKQIIVILLVVSAIAFASCDKYCTCTVENGGQTETFDVEPNENCSDYSNDNKSCY
jgi:hypothetical protein